MSIDPASSSDDLSRNATEEIARVLSLYKSGLGLIRYKSLWYKLRGWFGSRSARFDYESFRCGEAFAVAIVNQSPEHQKLWTELADREPNTSPAKPFLKDVLRPICVPLRRLSSKERESRHEGLTRSRNRLWFLENQLRKIAEDYAQKTPQAPREFHNFVRRLRVFDSRLRNAVEEYKNPDL
ncbi:MAG TPA: hypothetical protein VF283_17500 [Bryobacteraceae bacterium]